MTPNVRLISAALSSPLYVPPREEMREGGGGEHGLTIPEQRQVIEATSDVSLDLQCNYTQPRKTIYNISSKFKCCLTQNKIRCYFSDLEEFYFPDHFLATVHVSKFLKWLCCYAGNRCQEHF